MAEFGCELSLIPQRNSPEHQRHITQAVLFAASSFEAISHSKSHSKCQVFVARAFGAPGNGFMHERSCGQRKLRICFLLLEVKPQKMS